MQKDNKVHHYWAGTTIPEEEYNVLEMTRVSLFINFYNQDYFMVDLFVVF